MIYHCGVQLKLRLNGATKAAPVRMLSFGGVDVPVNITRHRLARRYVVRVAEDGSLRLTVPRGASIVGRLRVRGAADRVDHSARWSGSDCAARRG